MEIGNEGFVNRYKYDSSGRIVSEIQLSRSGSDTATIITYTYSADRKQVIYNCDIKWIGSKSVVTASLDEAGRVTDEDKLRYFNYDTFGHLVEIKNIDTGNRIAFNWQDDDMISYSQTYNSFTTTSNFTYTKTADKAGLCPAKEFGFASGSFLMYGKPNKHLMKNKFVNYNGYPEMKYFFNSDGYVTKIQTDKYSFYPFEYDCR